MENDMIYTGRCHCGKIEIAVDGDLQQVVECNCSICSRRGTLLWFVPRQQLRLNTAADAVATYTFNTHRIQHHFCTTCGCAPFAEGTDKTGAAMAAVNVRCLDGVDLNVLTKIAFDGRSL
jgi:hypothetical protein